MLRRSVIMALVALAALPAAASAAPSLSRGPGFGVFQLTYTASGGVNDSLTISTNGSNNVVLDPTDNALGWAAPLPGDCVADGSNTVTCTTATFTFVFKGLDGNDFLGSTAFTEGSVSFEGGTGNDSFSGGSLADAFDGGDGNDFANAGDGDDTLTGGGGDDSLFGVAGGDTLDGGAGGDHADGGDGNDVLRGQGSSDTLLGGAGDDTLDGGDGRDFLTPGLGADDVTGGGGFDEIRYSDRATGSAGVRVSLDDVADDGEDGEGDNAHADVEDVAGGGGPDRLVGSDSGNVLFGGAGNDELIGGAGVDTLFGDEGDDRLEGRDGNSERLDCGSGTDVGVGDEIDRVVSCETTDLSADLVADADGDGSAKPTDCNDTNPAVHPGAAETPDNGVDENCDGADATNPDRDGDGSPRPADCDDGDATVRPGASEIRGNRVDEDCDGVANPFRVISSLVRTNFFVLGAVTRIQGLRVLDVPARSRIRLTCKGRGCSKKLRKGVTQRVKRKKRAVNLTRRVRKLRLRPKARVEVRITKAKTIGALVRIRTKRGKLPSTVRLCVPPGSKKGVEC